MRIVVMFVVAISMAACTKPNPNTCCVTQAQCEELGADELRPCEAGQACQASTCVASECQTSADCISPDTPVCILNLCVASCAVDDDCTGLEGRERCAPDGACVGCVDAMQCSGALAFCDAEDRSCRGCEREDECGSGVCLEGDGVCAQADSIVWVGRAVGSDVGTCTKSSPCATIAFGLQRVSASRPVIRVIGTDIGDVSTITVDRSVTIDATATRISPLGSAPIFNVTNGYATFEGFVAEGTNAFDQVAIAGRPGTTVRIISSSFSRIGVTTDGGAIEARSDSIREGQVVCAAGTVSIIDNEWSRSSMRTTNCQVTVLRSRFVDADRAINASGGVLRILNNVFVVPSEFTDLTYFRSVATGSLFAFNTIVNTSSVTMSPVALDCDSPTLKVTSNIIAYNSSNPIFGCSVDHSLFDLAAMADAETVGNEIGDSATFFVDRATGDYRLAPGSPAIGIAELGLSTEDFLGLPRPRPIASIPDAGAHEAP